MGAEESSPEEPNKPSDNVTEPEEDGKVDHGSDHKLRRSHSSSSSSSSSDKSSSDDEGALEKLMYDDAVNGPAPSAFGLGGITNLFKNDKEKEQAQEEYKHKDFARDAENGLSHEKM